MTERGRAWLRTRGWGRRREARGRWVHGPDSGPGLALPLSLRPEGVQGPGSARVKGEGTGECHPSVPCGEPRSQTRDSTPLSGGGGRGAWWGHHTRPDLHAHHQHRKPTRRPHSEPGPRGPLQGAGAQPPLPFSLEDRHRPGQAGRAMRAPRRPQAGQPRRESRGASRWRGARRGPRARLPTCPTSRRRNRPVIKPAPPCGPGPRVLVGSLLRRISRGTPSWGSPLRVRLTFAQGAIAGMGDPCSQHRSGGLRSVD